MVAMRVDVSKFSSIAVMFKITLSRNVGFHLDRSDKSQIKLIRDSVLQLCVTPFKNRDVSA